MPNKKRHNKANRSSGYGKRTRSLPKNMTAQEATQIYLSQPKPIRVIDLSDPYYIEELIREANKPKDYLWFERIFLFLGWSIAQIMIMGPDLIQAGFMIGLIFGGCCSNVFALEAIVKSEPESGLLITLTQFLLVAIRGYYEHFSLRNPPFFLRPNKVPLIRWLIYVLLFFTVNMLNNYAFGFNISVPVHIILRSGGSVTTMAVGWLWGKKYSRMQVISVALLTIGVVISAMADADVKGNTSSSSSSTTTTTNAAANQSITTFLTGLTILFLAQILSAIMGLYIQKTYETHGSHWQESLFYSHFLGLPLFIPFQRSLRSQLSHLLSSPPLFTFTLSPNTSTYLPAAVKPYFPLLIQPPRLFLALLANAITQYACIRGVNLLAARTSALTVTIVLNIRKLVSLLLSVWMFGNTLANGVVLGATIVFAAGGLYAWEGQRLSRMRSSERRLKEE